MFVCFRWGSCVCLTCMAVCAMTVVAGLWIAHSSEPTVGSWLVEKGFWGNVGMLKRTVGFWLWLDFGKAGRWIGPSIGSRVSRCLVFMGCFRVHRSTEKFEVGCPACLLGQQSLLFWQWFGPVETQVHSYGFPHLKASSTHDSNESSSVVGRPVHYISISRTPTDPDAIGNTTQLLLSTSSPCFESMSGLTGERESALQSVFCL